MAFFWEGNTGQISSPEQAARKRAVAQALLSQSGSGANNWGEGLARVAQALTGTVLEGRVSDAEAAGQERASALFSDLASGANPDAIIAALTSPDAAWATPAQSSIASALLQSGLERQDPMYQMGLEKAALELEALRNPAAPKPVFEGGQWWDIGSGMPTALTEITPEPTSLMTNIGAAGLVPGTPEYAEAILSSIAPAQTNITVGDQGQRIGSVPAGYAVVEDPTNPSGFRYELIPNSPQAVEAQAAADAGNAGSELTGRTANIVREDINRIKDIVQNSPWYNPAVGFGSKIASAIEGSNATNVAALSKTVLANIGFDRLQQMRDASPTGGALGAISDRELGTLQAVMGNLEQSQSVDQFLFNLDRLGEVYDGILQKAASYPNARQFGLSAQTPQPEVQPSAPTQGGMSQIPTFATQADFNAAPSGTVFKAPDGSIRVKP